MIAAVLHLDEGTGPALDRFDHMAGGLAHGQDVVDPHLLAVADAEIGQLRGRQPRSISRHCRARDRPRPWRQNVAGSVCAAQPVTMMRAAGFSRRALPDRLPRLPHRLAGHRAGVEDDRAAGELIQAGVRCLAAHHLGFIAVQAAAEGERPRCSSGDVLAVSRPGAGRRIEAAGEFPFGRAGEHDMVVGAPFDGERSARHGDRDAAPGACRCARRRPRPRRRRSRRPWSARRRAPRCASSCASRAGDLRRSRCWRARETSDGSRAAGRTARARRTRRPARPRRSACGLPIDTADGECSTGASIGPICSSMAMRRVAEFLGERDLLPAEARHAHVDGDHAVGPMLLGVEDAGDRLEGE